MQNKTTFSVTAAACAAAGLLLSAPAAYAQTAADFVPDCATGVLAYSPGLTAGSASNSAPAAGETITLNSGNGTFTAGSTVTVTFNGAPVTPNPVADGNGNASVQFTVPAGIAPGTFIVVFRGTRAGVANVVGVCFTVAAPIVGGGGGPAVQPPALPAEQPAAPVAQPVSGGFEAPARPSALPRTGSVELLAVAGLGAALVAMGAGTVVVARRRRSHDAASV